MATPKKNKAYEFSLTLVDAASPTSFKVNPTIAAGDFQVSTDHGAFANLATLPVVQPAGSVVVKINLVAAEMNGDKIMVRAKDVAGGEWEEAVVFLDVPLANVDDVNENQSNRLITDPVTGKMTLHDDADVATREWLIFEDAAATIPYRGGRIDRRDKGVDL